ncbi:MAG: valine--tRNA ligase [Alphaproteobacteria bacterium]
MLEKTFKPDEIEQRLYRRWEESGAFTAKPESSAEPFTIMIPPPNVTGSLHMGHALNNTLQDILIRYWRMNGRDALWQPGMDHAGIATQAVVEQQLAKEGVVLARGGIAAFKPNLKTIDRDAFIERVWKWKAESGGTITRQLRRLGASCDWSRERFTMDEGLSLAVRKVFVDLHKTKGPDGKPLIYRDKRLVNWDPKLHTAISDLEVDSRETKGQLWHFKYPIDGAPDQFIVVATTRPETMLGDTGVAVHPTDERYKHLVGKYAVLPIVGRKIKIVADEYADPEQGSGAVKITPAHDFNDFEVGRRHDLAMINIFDKDARIVSSPFDDFTHRSRARSRHGVTYADQDGLVGKSVSEQIPAEFHGLDRFEARKLVVQRMEELGLVEKIDAHTHMVPFGDRSGVPIEPWLTDQWFVDAKTLAQPCVEAVKRGDTAFVPKTWEKTYFDWMERIQPWCVSRQIWWGHQIPAWYDPDGNIFVEMTEEAAQAAATKHHGRPVALKRDEDVLDTWFSSALWPFSTIGWPAQTKELAKYYPGDVLVTGFDIIFFWVARMMMMGVHFMKDVPFKTVYIHALVRDEKGQKMSKSKGNVLDPLVLIDKYGADAVRFTLTALAAQGRDIKLSESRIEGYRNFCTKLWNAARYTEMNGCAVPAGFDPRANKLTVNRWIVSELAHTAKRLSAAIEGFRFNEAAQEMYQFVWNNFCDWYLEFTKPIIQGNDAATIAETKATTLWTLHQVLHLLHPIMPFITEELWGTLGEGARNPLVTAKWPALGGELVDDTADAEFGWVTRVISDIRAVRAEMNVPPAAKLPLIVRGANETSRQRLVSYGPLVMTLARLSGVEHGAETPKGSVQVVIDDATYALPLAGVIDLDQERARLNKELARLAGDIARVDQKLANENFVAKAPPEVIEEQRERKQEAERARAKVAEALQRLNAA